MDLWPHQRDGLSTLWQRVDWHLTNCDDPYHVIFHSPTGGGKTVCAIEMIQEAIARGWRVVVYTNRKALRTQISERFNSAGLSHGVRAAGETPSHWQAIQVSAIDTDYSRCIKRGVWDLHDADMVIIDEAHANKATKAQEIIKHHKHKVLIGLTATPIDVGHIYRDLIVAGKNSELRQCGAHLPAYHYDMGTPDMSGFRTSVKTGEYKEGDVVKAIMTPQIYGRVILHHMMLNEGGAPAIGFAPGVKESMWFVDRYLEDGISAAHIDGRHCYFGEKDMLGEPILHETNDDTRAEILRGSESGKYKIVWNRFVLREGIDMPWLYHCIFATAFGSLQSYLQAGGRVVRNHPSLKRVVIQDHGGNYHRHGSLNEDRQWDLSWTPREASTLSRKKQEPEEKSITCPNCKAMRLRGAVCPVCGYECKTKARYVVEQDGKLTLQPWENPKPKLHKSAEQKAWESAYYKCLRSSRQLTFKQCKAIYKRDTGNYPPRGLKLMPTNESDWIKPVKEVPTTALT